MYRVECECIRYVVVIFTLFITLYVKAILSEHEFKIDENCVLAEGLYKYVNRLSVFIPAFNTYINNCPFL